LTFKRRLSVRAGVRELRDAWPLVLTLTEREFRVRYKQAILGVAWAVLSPVALMLVFSLFFQRVAKIDTHGIPYPLFAYMGLLPWGFFSSSLSNASTSILTNKSLLNKLYCPREVFPLSEVGVAAVNTLISTSVLVVMFVGYMLAGHQVSPRATTSWVPLIVAVQLMFTVGVALITSSVVVYARDMMHALPIILQLGLFATPVAYDMSVIPEGFRMTYSFLNPLAPLIEDYRRTVLFGQSPQWAYFLAATTTSVVVLCFGYWLFKRLETRFADVA
jgi:ABC-2 type transport system permease protein/lipopolysaccharide transport system permease protein